MIEGGEHLPSLRRRPSADDDAVTNALTATRRFIARCSTRTTVPPPPEPRSPTYRYPSPIMAIARVTETGDAITSCLRNFDQLEGPRPITDTDGVAVVEQMTIDDPHICHVSAVGAAEVA